MSVWVTGAAGMLGTEVVRALDAAGVSFRATDREVDITQADAVRHYGDGAPSPEWIVNCAAWTAVDAAETNAAAAMALNADGPRVLAEYAADCGASLLHISTDYVFDGTGNQPYRPEDGAAPHSVYGRSKWAGEEAVRAILPRHVILRTAWLYGAGGRNFVTTILERLRVQGEVRVVADQYGSPTWARDLSEAVLRVVRAPAPRHGTWHFAGAGQTTWHGLAQATNEIACRLHLLPRAAGVIPVSTQEFPTPAGRPAWSVLDSSSFARDWSCKIPAWRDSLERFLQSLRAQEER